MLTRDEVIRLAVDEGLADVADDLAEWVRPGWRIERSAEGSTCRTRVGGDPDLAADEAWPRSHDGRPLVFLAQVDCGSLPCVDPWVDPRPWAHSGQLLRVFADLLDPDYGPFEAVGIACVPERPVQPETRPPTPEGVPRHPAPESETGATDVDIDDRFRDLPATPVTLVPFLSAPEWPSGFATSPPDERSEAYQEWRMRLRIDGASLDEDVSEIPWDLHHLLGEATSIHDDVRYGPAYLHREASWAGRPTDRRLAHRDAWRVLLALNMDPEFGLDIYDGGAIHVLAPVEDLAIGRYDRLICDVSGG